jgi:hypothetical protein
MNLKQKLNRQRCRLWLEIMAGVAMLVLAPPVKAQLANVIDAAKINATTQTKGAKRSVQPAKLPTKPPAKLASVTQPLGPKASATPVPVPPAPMVKAEVLPTRSAPPTARPAAVTPPTAAPANPAPQGINQVAIAVIKILSPTVDTVLDTPVVTVVLQFKQGSEVELRANGTVISSTLVGRTETNNQTHIVTQTWYGVPLKDGHNTLTATVKTASGSGSDTVAVKVRGIPVKLTVATIETRIPANARSTATIQGQLLDEQGNLSNRDTLVTLSANGGEFVGADADRDQAGFQVQAMQGKFTAGLQSGLKPQKVQIQAQAAGLTAFTQLDFETDLRPAIATGTINLRIGKRGTDFYGRLRDFLPANLDNQTQLDFNAAVFATGRVGEWLLTGAYNSARPLNETCDGTNALFRASSSCDDNYPVYGDSSSATVTTPSTDSVYLKLERTSPFAQAGTDYAMWGDYNTEELARKSQQFTAITRQLHGFKGNYNLGNLQLTAFYGNNVQGFQRDTIAPDGTSGYYFLSRRLLIEGSENVFVELEELNRPGTVLARQALNRGPDYEIDYDRGTLLFRDPILRTDVSKEGETLVRRIVVTYQYDTPGSNNTIYAGRAQYNLSRELGRESWIAGTYVKENLGVRNFELSGADVLFSFGQGTLIAEYAHSKNDAEFLGPVSGSAYRVELDTAIAKGVQGRAYYRKAETGFANNATISFVPGQTRYGGQVSAIVSPQTTVRVQYDHEDNRGIAPRVLTTFADLFDPRAEAVPGTQVDNSLTTISAGVQQKMGAATLGVDWLRRTRTDRLIPNALDGTSDQLRSRLTVPLTSRLTFLAQNELTLSSQVDAVYSDRTLLGLNWQVMPGVTAQLAQQFYTRGQNAGQSLTSFNVTGDYKLGPDTTLRGRYGILGTANEFTMQGAVGISQGITLSPGLKLDLAYEHIFGTSLSRTAAGTRFAQPFASGQSAVGLGLDSGDNYSVGLTYNDSSSFQASARYEHRSSASGKNTVITAAAAGKLSPSLTALANYQQANSANQTLVGLGDTATLRFGLAYRDPNDDKFNALFRYEYRKNPSTIPDTILLGSGTGSTEHLFGLEAIYAPNWRWEFYGKFALRQSTSYLASDLVGSNTVTLAQARATYRLGRNWDLVGEARWIGQPAAGFNETGLLIETGYYLTPNLRLSGGYSLGRVTDRDFAGSRSAGGFYAGLSLKLNDLFNGFGLQKVVPPQQLESQPQPQPIAGTTVQPGGVATSPIPALPLPPAAASAPGEP